MFLPPYFHMFIFSHLMMTLGLKVCGSCHILLKEYILVWIMLQVLTLFLSQDDCLSY